MMFDFSPGKFEAASVALAFVRPLVEADIALYQATESAPKPPPMLKRLKDSHHLIARTMATGLTTAHVSALTGVSPQRITSLKQDPQFQELLAFYRDATDDVHIDVLQRMSILHMDILEEIAARLEDNPSGISTSLLLEMQKAMADRTGFGPASKTTNVNVNVNMADRLRAGRERVKALQSQTTIDVVATEIKEVVSGTE